MDGWKEEVHNTLSPFAHTDAIHTGEFCRYRYGDRRPIKTQHSASLYSYNNAKSDSLVMLWFALTS